jgi:hypothetical protein
MIYVGFFWKKYNLFNDYDTLILEYSKKIKLLRFIVGVLYPRQ